jgi:hypothetical protein
LAYTCCLCPLIFSTGYELACDSTTSLIHVLINLLTESAYSSMLLSDAILKCGTHNPSISAQTVRNRLREVVLRACRPVVRQVLTRHHQQQRRLWAQTHRCWSRQDWQKVLFTDESWFCLTRGDVWIAVYCRSNECYTESMSSRAELIWRWRVRHGLWQCVTASLD